MDEKILASDFLVKSANLCEYLRTDKGEKLICEKLFDSCNQFSKSVYSLSNPLLSKAEVASLRKAAALECDSITLHLSALFTMGLISTAQKDSVIQSLLTVKKQINI